MRQNKLIFGTAGIPLSTPNKNTLNGIRQEKKLGLGCMELEFVHGVNVSKEMALEVRRVASEEDIILTCHAPYYINLNSPDKAGVSMERIEKSAEILDLCGGWSVCFHPGFYQGEPKDKVFETIKSRIKEIRQRLDDRGMKVWLRPETTGKPTQFGDYEELLKISQEVEGVMPVFDFSHLHARTGALNSEPEFREILGSVEKHKGREGLDNMHIHLSGIEYGAKGEKNHLLLEESDLEYKALLKIWKEFRIKGCVISESPDIEGDALLLQKIYNTI